LAETTINTGGFMSVIEPDLPVTVIEAGRTERRYWRDLWRYRELFHLLAWRDVMVRYKQTAVGVAWALFQPLVMVLILTFVRSLLGGPTEGPPLALVILAGLIPWQFFAQALTGCSNSLVQNANLLSKVYFPRLIVPASAIVVALVDYLISLAILAGMMAYYGVMPSWRILTLPLLTAVAFLAALGPGLWFAALNVKYRDFRYIVPVIVAFGLYASPIIYETSMVPERFRLLYSLNPMAGVIEGFRWAILGTGAEVYAAGVAVSLAMQVVLLASGVWYFRRVERTFADVI